MAKLIYIKTSPRARSHSSKVAREFLDAYRSAHPQDVIEELDLWKMDLPPFDGDTIDAKYAVMHQQTQSEGQQKAWGKVVAMFQQFAAGDKYLFSVPMWNFGIPYRLKHYIDILTQPGLAFKVENGNYIGLVQGKPALVISASGGVYRSGSGAENYDYEKTYMDLWLKFIGFKEIQYIAVDGTLGDPAKAKATEEACIKEAREIAKNF